MSATDQRMTRIAVFYDGNYFTEVSNYYRYYHDRRSRINLYGLHDFIRTQAAQFEAQESNRCQIIEAHYFRGRLSADAAVERNILEGERRFEDVLMRVGIVQHYHPVEERETVRERGIDVWLALEAFDLAVHKQYEILALIACDGDYVPLIRKLNGVGTRVMLLAWDFSYTDDYGRRKETRTSQQLIHEASYPLMMHDLIDSRSMRTDPLINGLFMG